MSLCVAFRGPREWCVGAPAPAHTVSSAHQNVASQKPPSTDTWAASAKADAPPHDLGGAYAQTSLAGGRHCHHGRPPSAQTRRRRRSTLGAGSKRPSHASGHLLSGSKVVRHPYSLTTEARQ